MLPVPVLCLLFFSEEEAPPGSTHLGARCAALFPRPAQPLVVKEALPTYRVALLVTAGEVLIVVKGLAAQLRIIRSPIRSAILALTPGCVLAPPCCAVATPNPGFRQLVW